MKKEKEFTREDMREAEMFIELRTENNLLKRILEQKLEIELLPKLRMGTSEKTANGKEKNN